MAKPKPEPEPRPSELRDVVSSSASRSRSRACMFCSVRSVKSKNVLFEDVYIFDLDQNPNPIPIYPVAPVLRFKPYNNPARCVINSRLYLFDGSKAPYYPPSKSVHIVDLSSFPSSQPQHEEIEPKAMPIAKMPALPSMKGFKSFPCAIPTPSHTKILVFSQAIVQYHPVHSEDGYIDFELFDCVKKTWVELPTLTGPDPAGWDWSVYIKFGSYYFTDEDTFVVHTTTDDQHSLGNYMFTLRLDDLPRGWEVSLAGGAGGGGGNGGGPPLLTVGDDDSLSLSSSTSGKCCFYLNVPENPFVVKEKFDKETDINVLDRHQLCISYLAYEPILINHKPIVYPHVLIEVYDINLATCAVEPGDGGGSSGGGRGGGSVRGRGRGRGRGGRGGRGRGGRGSDRGRGDGGCSSTIPTLTPTKKTGSYKFDLIPYWDFNTRFIVLI